MKGGRTDGADVKTVEMTPKRTELLEKMGLTDSDAILMCVPLRYQSREVIPYDQWQVKSEVILEGQIVRPARTMRIRGGKTMTKFQLENDDDCFEITIFNRPWASNLTVGQRVTVIGYYQGGNKDHSHDVQLAAAAGTAWALRQSIL